MILYIYNRAVSYQETLNLKIISRAQFLGISKSSHIICGPHNNARCYPYKCLVVYYVSSIPINQPNKSQIRGPKKFLMTTANDFMSTNLVSVPLYCCQKRFTILLLQKRPFCLKSMKIIGVGIILRVGLSVWVLYLDFTGLHN